MTVCYIFAYGIFMSFFANIYFDTFVIILRILSKEESIFIELGKGKIGKICKIYEKV